MTKLCNIILHSQFYSDKKLETCTQGIKKSIKKHLIFARSASIENIKKKVYSIQKRAFELVGSTFHPTNSIDLLENNVKLLVGSHVSTYLSEVSRSKTPGKKSSHKSHRTMNPQSKSHLQQKSPPKQNDSRYTGRHHRRLWCRCPSSSAFVM